MSCPLRNHFPEHWRQERDMLQTQIPEAAIRDTLAEVFRHAEYARAAQATIGDRIRNWIMMMVSRLFGEAEKHPIIFQTARALVIIIALAIIARSVYLAWQRAKLRAEALANGAGGPGHEKLGDAWQLAQRYAKEGRYTEAAHALYWHLLELLAKRENIILHPSKTVGDYGRELRNTSSRLFGNYRDFARTYEVVIYGLGICDRERYDRLLALATAMMRTNG
jgi:hypothetical protein